jgi:hypothetical protein
MRTLKAKGYNTLMRNQDTKTPQKTIRYSMRIDGIVTSIVINRMIVSLFLTLQGEVKNTHDYMLGTISGILSTWEGETGKGLSEYVTKKLLEELLEDDEIDTFRSYIKRL